MVTGIDLERAVSLMTEGISPLGGETVSGASVLGRTLVRDIMAPMDQPPFDRSPLDGYALRAEDSAAASKEQPVCLTVVETVCAGDIAKIPVEPGQAVRVMTGAMLPQGCDCVLRQEDTDMGFPVVSIYKSLRPNDNFVNRGEDYWTGSVLLPAETRLDAAAVGLLASAGLDADAFVHRRPRVCVLSAGDEIAAPWERPLPPGKIYGSNLALLTARLTELGITNVKGKRVKDDPAAAAVIMRQLLDGCDLLITTGGVSVGVKDIFHHALPLLGAEQVFWKVRLKPGSPAMFSRCQGKPILSLSGNPFAAAATFELLARPLLYAFTGEPHLLAQRRRAILDTAFSKASPGRRFVRGRYADSHVSLPAGHSSGVLSSLVGCNCMVDIPAGSGPLEAGREVNILLL